MAAVEAAGASLSDTAVYVLCYAEARSSGNPFAGETPRQQNSLNTPFDQVRKPSKRLGHAIYKRSATQRGCGAYFAQQ